MEHLQKLVNELNTTNSTNEKQRILEKYPECKKLLHYVYSPFKKFYITSDNIKKVSMLDTDADGFSDIFQLLDALSERKITGYDAIRVCRSFINDNKEYKELIYNIIDKNLKIRLDSKVINKVFLDCIPTFDVALANSYDDHIKKVDFDRDTWFGSRKLDGCRCIAIIGDDIEFFSRSGNEFETLQVLKDELSKYKDLKGYVLDGEICLINEGIEDFQGIMKEIRKKNHIIIKPRYMIFDMIPYDHFISQFSPMKLSLRHKLLKNYIKGNDILTVLPQNVMNDDTFKTLWNESTEKGWEGLIIRKDTDYKGKRSNDMLKVKSFFDGEYKVIRIEVGDFRVINKKTKLEETIKTMSNVIIKHKGFEVSVGSGFTFEQRKEYYNDPDKIIGTIITVKYFSESINQDGGISLRFPTVKHIYGDKREI